MAFFEDHFLHFSKVLLKICIYCVKEASFYKPVFFFQSLLDHHHPQLTSSSPGMYLTQLTSNRDYADIHVQLMEDSIVSSCFSWLMEG